MTSQVDDTIPVSGSRASKAALRDNFATIKSELTTALGGFATDGWVRADSFDSEAAILTYANANRPFTLIFPPGVYDFSGETIPAGIHCVGPGWLWSNGQSYGGYGLNAAVLVGPISQDTGPSGGSFRGLVVSGGLEIRKQNCVIDYCAFTGSGDHGLLFDFNEGGNSPYSSTVMNCIFRGISGGPGIKLIGQANANRIVYNVILVGTDERGIVAEYEIPEGPIFNYIVGNDIEKVGGVTQIGSYIYGDFRRTVFQGNYFDAAEPTFTDGAAIVLGSQSRDNRFYHGNQYTGESVINSGQRNVFINPSDVVYTNVDEFDAATRMGIPKMYLFGTNIETATLPDIGVSRDMTFDLVTRRSEGTTISGQTDQTINGSGTKLLTQNTRYTACSYGGTDWLIV